MSATCSSSCPPALTATTTTSSSPAFSVLPCELVQCALAPLLATADLLAAATVDRATRRLLLSPAIWRDHVFATLPATPSLSSLPSWCEAVQRVGNLKRASWWKVALSSFPRFPNLRVVHLNGSRPIQTTPSPVITSLASVHQLTRLSLSCVTLQAGDLRLLSTLPALASFAASHMPIPAGDEETERDWRALSARETPLCSQREAEEEEKDSIGETKGKDKESNKHDVESDEDVWFQDYRPDEDPNDPRLPQKHSPLLLFLHALALKPSLVHLTLDSCDVTPFVMDRLPVWPHLRCLSLPGNRDLRSYCFVDAHLCFPSLTSLTSPNCADKAIAQLCQLLRLEELRFPEYEATDHRDGRERTPARDFRALHSVPSLRAVRYEPPPDTEGDPLTLAEITSLLTLTHLTRLTVNAYWLSESHCTQLFTQHRFTDLRCLELLVQYDWDDPLMPWCPQTDVALLPLVKPSDVMVAGREARQAARAAKRKRADIGTNRAGDGSWGRDIPAGNADSFPALECLALPYRQYNRGNNSGAVSAWMMRELRRSYEYEVAKEWEAEVSTLGEAELLRTMA